MLHTCNAVLVAAFMAPNGYITCTIQTQLHFHIDVKLFHYVCSVGRLWKISVYFTQANQQQLSCIWWPSKWIERRGGGGIYFEVVLLGGACNSSPPQKKII